ncbi:MAG TPA: hypothetical protein VJJ78_02400 [Candidatus Saccharimonadales bacterium]|nr:hypothetical protein [Candidatus Saccharimonadales bacterium]
MADALKELFFADPTNEMVAGAFCSRMIDESFAALSSGRVHEYSEKMQLAKIIGKFLPITDERNPDCPVYTSGSQGSRSES